MNRKQYLAQRQGLMDEANALIEAGKVDEANAKMDEVKALDEQFEASAKAQANLTALSQNPQAVVALGNGDAIVKDEAKSIEEVIASNEYKNAWAKNLMGKALTADESKAFQMVDAYTHTTGNTGAVVPTNVAQQIWEKAAELYPYFAEVTKTYVNGNFSMAQEDTSSAAGWYAETGSGSSTADGKEELKTFTLTGRDLARNIVISWKLKEMSVDDFLNYIERKMAEKMGAAADYGMLKGAGSSSEEPTGVITALKAETSTPQVVEYTTAVAYADILSARSKISSGYAAGLKIYANSATIWTVLANLLDTNKRPLFMADPMTGGFKVLGCEVEEDANMADGDILFSNPARGYHCNINKDVTMTEQDDVVKRTTTYAGYAIMDGNVTTTKAHALVTKKVTG